MASGRKFNLDILRLGWTWPEHPAAHWRADSTATDWGRQKCKLWQLTLSRRLPKICCYSRNSHKVTHTHTQRCPQSEHCGMCAAPTFGSYSSASACFTRFRFWFWLILCDICGANPKYILSNRFWPNMLQTTVVNHQCNFMDVFFLWTSLEPACPARAWSDNAPVFNSNLTAHNVWWCFQMQNSWCWLSTSLIQFSSCENWSQLAAGMAVKHLKCRPMKFRPFWNLDPWNLDGFEI